MLKLVSFSKKNITDVAAEIGSSENRKKSSNMILASAIVKEILQKAQTQFSLKELNVIFCSGEGEIHQTYEFFKNLGTGHARPILFQNSLHNSTLGALSLELPHIASGLTLSDGDISFEAAIDAALASPSDLPVLILGVDAYNSEIQGLRSKSYGPSVSVTSGGCGGLFIPASHPLFYKLSGPIIKDIKFSRTSESATSSNYYPSNGLESIVENLATGASSFSLVRPYQHLVTVLTHEA